MKKTLQTIAVGTLLLSGLSISHDADAKSYKETRLNYLDKSVIKKVKAGKITTLDGYKLGTSLKVIKKDKRNRSDFFNEYEPYQLSTNSFNNGGSNNKAYVDLCDVDCKAYNVITRLVDNVVNDNNQEKLTRTRLLKLYGTPSKSNQQFIKDDSTNYRLDYYKFGTFVYSKNEFTNKYYLESVQYFGKELKKHPDRFKRLVKYNLDNYSSSGILDESFSLKDWKTI